MELTEDIIKTVLVRLKAKPRPIFYSEADFQFSLAWELREFFNELNKDVEICLEYPHEGKYVDMWINLDGESYPIELKYKTRILASHDKYNLKVNLKNQGAQDVGRLSFLYDIQRIEEINEKKCGFALILTNDPTYYNMQNRTTVDEDFRIYNGRKLPANVTLKWKDEASKGTVNGLKKADHIKLQHNYTLSWCDYIDNFKYLLCKIC